MAGANEGLIRWVLPGTEGLRHSAPKAAFLFFLVDQGVCLLILFPKEKQTSARVEASGLVLNSLGISYIISKARSED